jgi:AraC-like DNA-binding protein
MNETARAWNLNGLEIMHGDFVKQSFPRHAHDTFAVVLIERGSSGYWYRGANRTISAGQIAFLNPDEVHTGRSLSAEGYSQRSLYLEPARFPNRFFHQPQTEDPVLARCLREFHSSLTSDALESSTALEFVLERLRTTHLGQKAQRITPERLAVTKARASLESDLGHALSLQELARTVGLSPYHLARVFQREVGLSPHAYRTQARVNRAKTLLRQGLDAAEIALEVGFSSQSHLIAQFKRYVGVTPSRFSPGR